MERWGRVRVVRRTVEPSRRRRVSSLARGPIRFRLARFRLRHRGAQSTVLAEGSPRLVIGCDRSPGYVAYTRRLTADDQAAFVVAELPDLPRIPDGFGAVVAGLVLNFLPSPAQGVVEMAARARKGGTVAAYVWDYAEGMQLMRIFCAGVRDAMVQPIVVPIVLRDFDDYWSPSLSGQGPAPAYVMSRPAERRTRLRDMIRQRLPSS